jgi:HAD superfamily hydrolase (TIGR01509 family)
MAVTYLFDFDGTLVDSMPTFVSTVTRILDEHKIPCHDELIRILTPLGADGVAEYFEEQLGIPVPKEQLSQVIKQYIRDAYFYKIPAKNNVIPVLKELKRRGARLNILTGSPHVTLDVCLKRLEMWDLFDNVWSCEDFNTTKADPNIYVMAAERMGTTVDQVLFLDDNPDADKTAKAAGMIVCGVYDASSANYVDQMKEIDDFFIYDFSELLELPIA